MNDEEKPSIEDLKEAIEDGRVDLFTEGEFVYEDPTGSRLIVKSDTGMDGTFGLTAADEGGFTGLCIEIDEWENIRAHIDALVKEKRASKFNA